MRSQIHAVDHHYAVYGKTPLLGVSIINVADVFVKSVNSAFSIVGRTVVGTPFWEHKCHAGDRCESEPIK